MKEEKKISFKSTFEMLGVDPKKSFVFPFVYNGVMYAANHKKKKTAVVTISLPPQIVDEDLSKLEEWVFLVLAYPRPKKEEKVKQNE